ncbi:acyl-CoA dehydratase activase [Chloroflexota bacterium]
MKGYLGIDVGSVSTKFAMLDEEGCLLAKLYLLTEGQPVVIVQRGLRLLKEQLPLDVEIGSVVTTGSARALAGVIVGADLVKNEITCQALGALHYLPEVQTVIEIGGQDSKMIILRNGLVADFGMNTVCAAGTGSFLDHQALRLQLNHEQFAQMALSSNHAVDINARCTVFAESDMIHKQQTGHRLEDIVYGICRALVRNYLHDVGSGREIQSPVVFQGGVAFNRGIVRALAEELGSAVIVPENHEVLGAIGAALLGHEEMLNNKSKSKFQGFDISEADYRISSFTCKVCPSFCEMERLSVGEKLLTCWGGRCDLWTENANADN